MEPRGVAITVMEGGQVKKLVDNFWRLASLGTALANRVMRLLSVRVHQKREDLVPRSIATRYCRVYASLLCLRASGFAVMVPDE